MSEQILDAVSGKPKRGSAIKAETEHGGRVLLLKNMRLLAAMAVSLLTLAALVVSSSPGAGNRGGMELSQALLSERTDLEVDSSDLAARVMERKSQVHMEEMDQQMGEIPYVEIWVLNDPFYPLIGEVSDLRDSTGVLSSKEWQMLGFPDYTAQQGTSGGGAPATTPPSSLPVTTSVPQRVIMVEEVYEIRGIRYADIKVNEVRYDKLKNGSEFADVFKLQEIKDTQTVTVLCGDETYELKVNQLRKI